MFTALALRSSAIHRFRAAGSRDLLQPMQALHNKARRIQRCVHARPLADFP